MAIEATKKVIAKIPAFRGLSFSQAYHLLRGGEKVVYTSHEVLCREGDKSTDMYVLLTGELSIKSNDTEISRVRPVDVVGEMGLITGLPRCATIEVVGEATLFKISKDVLDKALEEKHEMAAKVYKNMLDSLCRRLREANVQFVEVQSEVHPQIAPLVV